MAIANSLIRRVASMRETRLFSVVISKICAVASMRTLNKNTFLLENIHADNDIADLIISKGYLPEDNSDILHNDHEHETESGSSGTYILSKLADKDLLKLLSDQPKKKEYNLNDIINLASDWKPKYNTIKYTQDEASKSADKQFRTEVSSKNDNNHGAYFKLDDREVDPFSTSLLADPNTAALEKLNNLLYSRPVDSFDDEKREFMFDVLVTQLKALCCKSTKPTKKRDNFKTKELSEYLFLILNDEVKSKGSDELIYVDPDTLEKNSSVLLLGPISKPLTDSQLKAVINRISRELSKPDYVPLLEQLADGTLSSKNSKLVEHLVTGPATRRYIKPHRCNHQSKLVKVYGGPKWIICTGYLNINTASLYD